MLVEEEWVSLSGELVAVSRCLIEVPLPMSISAVNQTCDVSGEGLLYDTDPTLRTRLRTMPAMSLRCEAGSHEARERFDQVIEREGMRNARQGKIRRSWTMMKSTR